jgi:penicillin-binding protein 2
MRLFRQKWYAGETISVSIGQGALTVTPIQLVTAVSGIGMGGVWHRPHLVKAETAQEKPRLGKIDPVYAQKVVYGMYGVVNEGGTGIRAHLPGISVCGKTGSAQRISNEAAKGGVPHDMKDNAWFVAFAPCEAPEIAVSVLWEGGVHGQFAAGIARDVLKAYFDKKARAAKAQMIADMKRAMPPAIPMSPLTQAAQP